MQRFLRGWRASSSRDVELPVEGPVSRVIHSADGQWLACEVAPSGGTRSQIWVVTTDPDDRMAWRIDDENDGTAELIGWDGTRVAAILTGEDGVGISCLIDPADGRRIVVDRRSGGRLVDAWAGAALIRVGPRGYHEMIMLHGLTEIALLPADPGSTTADGMILDDHHPRRIRHGPEGELSELYQPGADGSGYVRALIRSDNGCEHARLLEVTATPDGVSYYVVAERADCDLEEFAVSDDLSTVALLWNVQGRSELQILEYADDTLQRTDPAARPGRKRTVRQRRRFDGRTDRRRAFDAAHRRAGRPPLPPMGTDRPRAQSRSGDPRIFCRHSAGDDHRAGWVERQRMAVPAGTGDRRRRVIYLHGGPEGQARPGYSEIFARLVGDGITVLAPNVRGSGGLGRNFVHADDKEKRFGAINDVADCVRFLVDNGVADPRRVACAGWSYGGFLTLAALTFHPELFAAGISICGMSDLTTFYRHTEPWIAAAAYPKYGHPVHDRELLEELSPLRRVDALTAPLLVVHGAMDTNVPVGESEQIVEALQRSGRDVRYLLFGDDGHGIIKRENRAALATAMSEWLTKAFAAV